MDYLDFELRVGQALQGEHAVEVLRSPVGETEGRMRLPFDAMALQNQLQAVQIAVLRSASTRRGLAVDDEEGRPRVAEFGRKLFEAVMTDEVRDSFRRSQDRARAAGKGLRVRLRIEDPALANLPWEYLYDPAAREFVVLSSDTPVVRYLEMDRPPEPMRVEPPLSVLGVIASPHDRAGLDVKREMERVETATQALRDAGLLKLTWLDGSTWRALQRAMRQGPYHVFHFVGHGGFDSAAGEGIVALTDDEGNSAPLTATQLGRLLCDHRALRLAVLNSCLGAKGSGTDVVSSTASMLIRRGVPAVIAMQYEISDGAAIEFARSLYEALAEGVPVDAAVAEARKAMSFAAGDSVEWGTPVLHMRSPDGVLFTVDAAQARAVRETREQRTHGPGPSRGPSRGPSPGPSPRPSPRRMIAIAAILAIAAAASWFAHAQGWFGSTTVADSAGTDSTAADSTAGDSTATDTTTADTTAADTTAMDKTAAAAPAEATTEAASAEGPRREMSIEIAERSEFTQMGASVREATLAGAGQGAWTLRLQAEHAVTNGLRVGAVHCRLRAADDADGVDVDVPFRLEGREPTTELTGEFRIAHPWKPGEYPISCHTQRGDPVLTGTVTVR